MTIYKEDIQQAKLRVDAWWEHALIDRVVVQVRVPHKPPTVDLKNPNPEAAEEWFMSPDLVIPRLKRDLSETFFGGEAFPVVYPVSGKLVAITTAFLGSPLEFLNTQAVWSHPSFSNWQERPEFNFNPTNRWWQKSKLLLQTAVETADGSFIGVPDLNGPTEILARLRGTQELALDFYDNPQQIKPALVEVNRAWYEYWQACVAITHPAGGYFNWMGIWSDIPATDLQSDFSTMISKEMFDEYFLPFIAEQTEMVPRTIYHLDGPGAVKHLDSLLDLPELDGIQWVPGARTQSIVEWIPLLTRIQDARKLLYVYCDKNHVRKLVEEMDPEGLMMVVEGCRSRGEVLKLLDSLKKWSKKEYE